MKQLQNGNGSDTARPVFEKRRTPRAYEAIVEQVERAILTGAFKAGDRLSPERDLIAEFGVSRSTIREALRVLQSRGLIAVRHGDPAGPTVTADLGANVTSVLSSLYRADQLDLVDVVQFRIMLEGTAAELAASAPKAAIAKIRRAYEQMREAKTWDDLLRCDILFHRQIAEATGNPIFSLVVDAMHHFNSVKVWQSNRSLERAREETLTRHGQVLAAIEAKDGREAKRLSVRFLRLAYKPLLPANKRSRLLFVGKD